MSTCLFVSHACPHDVRYDWMREEPNDHHSQNCLTFLKDQDIFGFFVWHWNDWDCGATAGYICEFDL